MGQKKETTEPRVLAIILGGGKGTRLYPLTKERSKPAVPFGGKYRIVDIPISNCINSGYRKIYLLTQFNSASLHQHIINSYNFDRFSRGFVEILAAEQTLEHSGWYEGTADAVRKNISHFRAQNPTHYVILSGDQLYRENQSFYDGDAFCDKRTFPEVVENARALGYRHLIRMHGTTFDVCYNRYKTVQAPGEHRREVRNDTLKYVLAEVMRDMRERNRCYIKYEVHQGCWHITVR